MPVFDFWSEHQDQRFWIGQTHRAQVRHLTRVIQREEIDLVYDRTFHMTLQTGPACRKTNTPRISVIVSPPSRDFVQSRERFALAKKWLLKRAYRQPNSRTIAVSQAVARDASQFYGIAEDKIEVIPSPVDWKTIEESAGVRRVDKGPFSICVVGRLSSEKGQALAIEAFARFCKSPAAPPSQLEIVGDGPDRDALQKLAVQLGVQNQIRFHGFLANPYPMMKNADVLLIPSQYEGLPNVVLEAMALGTAVIATRCSESLESLIAGQATGQDQRGVLVPVGSVDAMAEALLQRVNHSEVWADRIAEGQLHLHQHHGLPHWLKQMEELCLRVVESARSRDA